MCIRDRDKLVDVSCNGDSDGFIMLDVFGTAFPFTFSWAGPNGFTDASQDIFNLFAGTYMVTVTDANGNSTVETYVINEPPNCLDPTNVTASNIGLTSSTMSWDAVSVTGKYDFRFREVGSSTWNTITNFLGTSYTLNGLSDGTDYEFEVRSMCGGGYYSSWVSATFTTVLACTTPTNLSSSSVTPSSATISWDAVTGAQLADDAVNSEHYTDGSVDTAHIADANVTTAKVADDAITAAKINNDIISGSTALTSSPDDTDELLISDAGTIKRIDVSLVGGKNSPYLEVVLGTTAVTLTSGSASKIPFNVTKHNVGGGTWDSEITFDFGSLTGAVAGTYLVPVGEGSCPVYGCTDENASQNQGKQVGLLSSASPLPPRRPFVLPCPNRNPFSLTKSDCIKKPIIPHKIAYIDTA